MPTSNHGNATATVTPDLLEAVTVAEHFYSVTANLERIALERLAALE